MPTTKTRKPLWQIFTAGLLLIGCAIVHGCSSGSIPESRLTRLIAPNQFARSSGGAYATTDSYLSALEIPNTSQQMLSTLSSVPKDDAIIFVASDSTPETELVYRTVAYLGWPRQIGALHCGAKNEPHALLFKPREDKPIRWLIFYRRQIPAGLSQLSRSIELGVHLKLISAQTTKEWNFYCSQ